MKYRDTYCIDVTEDMIGKEISLAGFVANIRDHGGVLFLDLRDSTSVMQIVSNDDSIFKPLTKESVITLTGIVRKRSLDTINEKISTGTVELLIEDLEILSKSKNELPFEIITSRSSQEDIRFKYRYLDLRNDLSKENIIFRSKVISHLRAKMESLGFMEFQTPILTSSSPEGARDFVVPSRLHKGKFYALPQAPQMFKQLVMVSGFDKYFQIAPCFRDEDARSDRAYGEFYQLDLEMSFACEEDILKLGEDIFYETFTKFSNKKVSSKPFKRIPYKEAMLKYGTDKPDLRNPLEIIDVSDIFKNTTFKPFDNAVIRAIVVDKIGENTNSWFNDIVYFAEKIGMPGIGYITLLEDRTFKGPIDKFLSETEREDLIKNADLKKNSVIFFIANKEEKIAANFAGQIRTKLGEKLNLIDEQRYEFCIINDFPMFEYNELEEKYDFTHNPFSMPKTNDFDNINPEDIIAYQYDFICNGIEISSGAVRNHRIDLMEKIFDMAGYTKEDLKERFAALYEAFNYGAPPHAGMAPGIDRIVMLLTNEKSIREITLFPLNGSGVDNMMKAPSIISENQLRETHIKIRD